MEGIFLRKKFNIWLLLLFICGLCFIGMYIFLNIVDPIADSNLITFLIIGILIDILVIPSWLLNHRAFIRINEDSLKAKYHLFGKIDCNLSDVTYAVARVNTLIIQLKDGKCHTIMGVQNPFELASAIRINMSFDATKRPEELFEELNGLKSKKKNRLIYVCSGILLLFVNVFATVFLTDGKEMYEFSATDWKIFAVMSVMEIMITIATFYFAKKTGSNTILIERLQYSIRRTIIETQPLPYEHAIKVFTDDDYSGRITICVHPNQESVYYIIQTFASDLTFFKSHESKMYESIEELPIDLDEFIDITKKVLYWL